MHEHQWFLKLKTCTTIVSKMTHRAHDRSQSSANMFIRSYLKHANHSTPPLKVFQERKDSSSSPKCRFLMFSKFTHSQKVDQGSRSAFLWIHCFHVETDLKPTQRSLLLYCKTQKSWTDPNCPPPLTQSTTVEIRKKEKGDPKQYNYFV